VSSTSAGVVASSAFPSRGRQDEVGVHRAVHVGQPDGAPVVHLGVGRGGVRRHRFDVGGGAVGQREGAWPRGRLRERRLPAGGQQERVLQHEPEVGAGLDRGRLDEPAGVVVDPLAQHLLAGRRGEVGVLHARAEAVREGPEVVLAHLVAVVDDHLVGQVHQRMLRQLCLPHQGRVTVQ
jgi:hypothetical protein